MTVKLLDHHNEVIGNYPAEKVLLLTRTPGSRAAVEELDLLHRRRHRLLCSCRRILHAVQREQTFLRRNPGQQPGAPECDLCRGATPDGRNRAHTDPLAGADLRLILATRVHPERRDERKKETADPEHGGAAQKYRRAFGVLFRLLEEADFDRLNEPLDWDEIWRRLRAPLARTPVEPGARRTLADYAWMPGRLYADGMRGLNKRLTSDWAGTEHQAEGWVFGIVPETPAGEDVLISPLSSAQREASGRAGRSVYPPYKISVPRHCHASIGRTGPFLALVICTPNRGGNPEFAKPVGHRALFLSVYSEQTPLPVESSYEREAAGVLLASGLRFIKPLLPNPDGIRPDFVLPDQRVILEVQGMESEEYRIRKSEIHEKIRSTEALSGYRLLTYDPNDGETVEQFAEKINSLARRNA